MKTRIGLFAVVASFLLLPVAAWADSCGTGFRSCQTTAAETYNRELVACGDAYTVGLLTYRELEECLSGANSNFREANQTCQNNLLQCRRGNRAGLPANS
jgi:hypothetical protein